MKNQWDLNPALPDTNKLWKHAKAREYQWKLRGVIRADSKPLDYQTYLRAKIFQKGKCAICNRNEFWGALHADHDKKTGLFRGLLCEDCNRRAMGNFEKHGHFKSRQHEKLLQEYLNNPPYNQMLKKGQNNGEPGRRR